MRVNILFCEICRRVKIVCTEEDFKMWNKAKRILSTSKPKKMEFECLKKDTNRQRGLPGDCINECDKDC
jgi:hypothetical protein